MKNLSKAIFGGGCFWCTEAIFQRIDGVLEVLPGYSGGNSINPTYEEVSTGETGHAEVIMIVFDPEKVSYRELLRIFMFTHDPTTLNKQGYDVGTQYRSAIFYFDDEQYNIAKNYIEELRSSNNFSNDIVTELVKFEKFYEAEDYHHNYYLNNPRQPYCSIVISPKILKLEKLLKRT